MPEVFIVEEDEQGQRLDQYLTYRAPVLRSRSLIQQWIKQGAVVRHDGVIMASAHYKVRPCDIFTVTVSPVITETHLVPQHMPLDIVYEDDAVIVINKPRGLVVHPAPGHRDHTLVNALVYHCQENLSDNGVRPGIVHRLDKGTSGLMVVAKTDRAHHCLANQLKNEDGLEKTLRRSYKALVYGRPPKRQMTLTYWMGRSKSNRQKMAILREGSGKHSITHITTTKTWQVSKKVISLLDCVLDTGRTHQIRVHLQAIRCPILGDVVYGRKAPDGMMMDYQALHACSLSFIHPETGDLCEFKAPMPQDMLDVMAVLDVESSTP